MLDMTKTETGRYGRHLVKLIWRYNSVGDHPICIKFGSQGQSYNLKKNFNIAAVCFQEPEVVISRPWIEMSDRNLVPIAWDRLKCETSPDQKREVDFRRCGRHLVKINNSVGVHLICIKSGGCNAESHANDSEKVKIKTRSRISVSRPFVFRNRKW